MKISEQIVKKMGVVLKLELATKNGEDTISTGPHKIKLLKDELVKGKDYATGKERQEIKYTVEEGGIKKTYNVPIYNKEGGAHYLIVRLSQYKEGDEITLEYKRKGLTGYIEVSKVGEELPSIDYGDELESVGEDTEDLGKEGGVDILDPLEVEPRVEV